MRPGWQLRYVDTEAPEYREARELRYDALYADWSLPRDLIEDTDGRAYEHLVAVEDDRVVGYARLHLESGESKIYQVCVSRDRRGSGIATGLMLELMKRARECGRDAVCLDAREHVRGFYRRLGFVEQGDTFLSGRTNTPHVHMCHVFEEAAPEKG